MDAAPGLLGPCGRESLERRAGEGGSACGCLGTGGARSGEGVGVNEGGNSARRRALESDILLRCIRRDNLIF